MERRQCAGPGCANTFEISGHLEKRFHNDTCRKRASRAGLSATGGEYTPARAQGPSHPKGWEPGFEITGDQGTITCPPTEGASPDFEAAFRSFDLDPEQYEILEPVNFRTWEMWTGGEVQTMRYFKANVRRRQSQLPDADVDALIERIRLESFVKPRQHRGRALESLIVAPADWQLGKRDGGGVELVIERALELPAKILARIGVLRSAGYAVNEIVLPFMGDLTEGCQGQYPMQAFQAELDQRSQDKLARRLALNLVSNLAEYVEHLTVLTVPGNHGENRIGGKAFTTFGDNRDISVIEQVAEITAAGGLDNVGYIIPDEQMELTLDVHGTIVGFAHGHQAGKAQPQKMLDWWKGQMYGRQPIGDADILLTAHFHHLRVTQEGKRTWFQCPALENESTWFKHQVGVVSPAGTLSMLVGPDGWSHLEVL